MCVSHSGVYDSLGSHGLEPPASSVHGLLQARILEWVAISPPRDLPDPGIEPGSPAMQAVSLPFELSRKPDNFLE